MVPCGSLVRSAGCGRAKRGSRNNRQTRPRGSDRVRACCERDGLVWVLSAHSAGVIDDNSTDDVVALFYNSHSGIHIKASACEQHCNHLPGGPNILSMVWLRETKKRVGSAASRLFASFTSVMNECKPTSSRSTDRRGLFMLISRSGSEV